MKFSVGDRVKIYGNAQVCAGFNHAGSWSFLTTPVVVTDIFKDSIRVRNDSGVIFSCHPKQCRKLKPKEKSVRVTKKMLGEAWDKYVAGIDFLREREAPSSFDSFCLGLGFKE